MVINMLNQLLKNPYPGRLITFEGIDGSGKSDQFKLTRELFLAMPGLNVIFTKEPPNNTVGVEIYDILRGHHPIIKLEDMSELEMQKKYFLARRMHYQDLILPALRSGVHVISDRGLVSVAYGLKNIAELDLFFNVQKAMFDFHRVPLIAPDLTLVFDVSIDVALERLGRKERERDMFEQRARLEQARNNYLAITGMIPGCFVVDGMPPVEEVFEGTKKHILDKLG